MIASTAMAEGLALLTTHPNDFRWLDHLLTVVPMTRPLVLGPLHRSASHERGTRDRWTASS